MDALYGRFGGMLRTARKDAGLTQQDLAERVGLTRTSITNVESGLQHINLRQLYLLAAAVGLRPAALLPDHDGATEELISEHALKDLEEDAEGLDFTARVLRKSRTQRTVRKEEAP
jgi:transcriptional regulator with XRE-family HTH domain